MEDSQWILIAAIALVVLALVAFVVVRQRKRAQLKDRFGPEYDRTIDRSGDRKAAEGELKARAQRRAQLDIRPLRVEARDRYAAEWKAVQARFVDEPDTAVVEADTLVARVMRDRGYPVDDFEAQADLVSVDHPDLVENYRAAHDVHERNRKQLATTDDLRNALLRYRSLFDELLVAEDRDRDAVPANDGAR